MKNILKVAFVIIGTLIGAGFASGQEIYLFFFSFGIKGLIGVLISSIFMGIVIYQTLNILNKYSIQTYKDFLNILIINKNNNKINIRSITNWIVNIFILITFFIMIAGFGAYFEQEFGINSLIREHYVIFFVFFYIFNKCKRRCKSK